MSSSTEPSGRKALKARVKPLIDETQYDLGDHLTSAKQRTSHNSESPTSINRANALFCERVNRLLALLSITSLRYYIRSQYVALPAEEVNYESRYQFLILGALASGIYSNAQVHAPTLPLYSTIGRCETS